MKNDNELTEFIEEPTKFMVDRIGFEKRLSDYQSSAITTGGLAGLFNPRPEERAGQKKPFEFPSLTMEFVLLAAVLLVTLFGLAFKQNPNAITTDFGNGTIRTITEYTSIISPNSVLFAGLLIMAVVFAPFVWPHFQKEPAGAPAERWITDTLTRIRYKHLACYMLAQAQKTDPTILAYYHQILPEFFIDRKKFLETTLPTEFTSEIGKITNFVQSAVLSYRAFLLSLARTGQSPMQPQMMQQPQIQGQSRGR